MDWTHLYLNTPITQLPKIFNDNFESVEEFINLFYDPSSNVLKVPLNTTGRVKGSKGEFVTSVVDNLIVRNQWTNLYENYTAADYDFYLAYIGWESSTRLATSETSTNIIWPYESPTYLWIDVNRPIYKISNHDPIAFQNDNLSQIVRVIFDTSVASSNDYEILLDPCKGYTYSVPVEDASKRYIELICVNYDSSWGPTWVPYKFGLLDPSIYSEYTAFIPEASFGTSFIWDDGMLDVSISSYALKDSAFNEISTAYTLVQSDNNKVIDASGTWTLTMPDNLSVGFQFTVINSGVGTITLDASNLLTINSYTDLSDQYAAANAVHKGSGTWYAWGDLK